MLLLTADPWPVGAASDNTAELIGETWPLLRGQRHSGGKPWRVSPLLLFSVVCLANGEQIYAHVLQPETHSYHNIVSAPV